MKLTDFRVLTFDCYGTLIDWESGITTALKPLLARGRIGLSRDEVLETYARHESAQEAETPAMAYPDILASVHRRLADEWSIEANESDHRRFGASVPDWPAFPDSADSLAYLKGHYRLVVLSNVDRAGFAASQARLGVAFDAVYTAQDIGSYKPDPANFRYMLEHLAALGHGRAEILHTAQSLFHDHAPAKAAGLTSAWIDRRHGQGGFGATMRPPGEPVFDVRFPDLATFVEAHRAELAERA